MYENHVQHILSTGSMLYKYSLGLVLRFESPINTFFFFVGAIYIWLEGYFT